MERFFGQRRRAVFYEKEQGNQLRALRTTISKADS